MSEQDNFLSRIEAAHARMSSFDETSYKPLLSEEELDKVTSYEGNTVTDFENNATVVKDYDVLTTYLADHQDFATKMLDSDAGPAEFLRDDFLRITSVAGKAAALSDAPENVKKAYRDLRTKWEETEVTGTKETLNAAKDYGTDVLANFETLPTALSLIFGNIGGATAQTSVRVGVKAALAKVLAKASSNPIKSTAAYTGAISGIQDLAVQDLEVEIGERKDGIDLGQAATAAVSGAVIGGALSYGIGKVVSKYATDRLARDLDDAPVMSESKGMVLFDEGLEGEWIPASGSKVINTADRLLEGPEGSVLNMKDVDIDNVVNDFVDDIGGGDVTKEEFKSVVTGALKSGATGKFIKNKLAFSVWQFATDLTGNFFGKSAGILTPYTKYSNTAKTLQTRFSHEFAEGFGKTKERIGMDLSEAQARYTGGFTTQYLKIVEPLSLNSIKGNVSDEVNDLLNQAIRGNFKGVPKEIGIAGKKIQGLFKTIGDQLYSEGVIANKIDNYIPRMWDRKAIDRNPDAFQELLVKSGEAKNVAEAERITESMLDIENQIDGGSGGQFFASKRKFTFKDDSIFTEFLNTDLMDVVLDYNYQAGKALAKKKVLLASNEKEFMSQWINPIVKEMKAAGKTLNKIEREQIRELYRSATGENMERYGSKMQTAADGYSLGTRLALLPLATIGSITEVFINIGKAGLLNSVKGFAEASELSFKKVTGDLHSELMTKHGLTANEAFRELKKHGIAMEQAEAQMGNRLAGDDLASETMQKVSNKFFRMNFLDQWTKFVQTATFASGKNLINENIGKLAAHGNQPMTRRMETLRGELLELNIDPDKAVVWLKKGGLKEDPFYEDMMSGAARYTNSVILQPSAMSGLKPLLHSNPKTSIAFQLLGYPAAFTNTVLKGAAKAVTKDAGRNVPKLAMAGLLMTETARMTNFYRSNGASERDTTPTEARIAAIKRWGGNGMLFDNLQRASEAAKYSGTITGYATAPFGPLATDALGIAYGKYNQVLGSKVPFYAAGTTVAGPENMRKYRAMLKEQDKGLKGFLPEFEYNVSRQQFDKGGEVNIPNAPTEPDERINKMTGRPYNEDAGSAFMDELDPKKTERQGFSVGSAVTKGAVKLSGYLAETVNDATDGILNPRLINSAVDDIKTNAGLNADEGQVFGQSYSPDDADFGAIAGSQADEFGGEEELEEYIALSIKTILREKDMDVKPYSKETLDIQAKSNGEYGEDFQVSRGYTEEEIDDFNYQAEMGEEFDPDQSLFTDIAFYLEEVREASKSHVSSLASIDKLEKVQGLEGIIDIFARNSKFIPAEDITDEGRRKIITSYIANNSDNSELMTTLKSMQADSPRTEVGQASGISDDARLKNLDAYLASSIEKTPKFRGISDFAEKDFEVAFVSPREMGVHVGTEGQANYMAAKGINDRRAEDTLSIPGSGDPKVARPEMDRFFADEQARREGLTMEDVDFENITPDELDQLGSMDLPPSSDMPNVSIMKGYVNVKNPLVFPTDASNWSAETLLTSASDQLIDAIVAGTGRKIPEKFQKRLNAMMVDALEVPSLPEAFNSSEQLITTSLRHVTLTKKLQKFLEDMSFDSIKYKNMVEPSLEGERTSGSYILFRPEQYKSINASTFDKTDKRMMRYGGGEVSEVPEVPEVPIAPEVSEVSKFTTLLGTKDGGKWEGSTATVYVPATGDNSGATVGTGFDIGQLGSVKELEKLGLSASMVTKLTPYLNLKGEAARKFVTENPLQLSSEEQTAVDSVVVGKTINQVKSRMKDPTAWNEMTETEQFAVIAAQHQYGDNTKLPVQYGNRDFKGATENLRTWSDTTEGMGDNIAAKYHGLISDILVEQKAKGRAAPAAPAKVEDPMTIIRASDNKEVANVTADQLIKTGLSFSEYMEQWKETKNRPVVKEE